jgi:hypothetical protein
MFKMDELFQLDNSNDNNKAYKMPEAHKNNLGFARVITNESGQIMETLNWESSDKNWDEFLKEMNLQDWIEKLEYKDSEVLITYNISYSGKGEDFEAWLEILNQTQLRANYKDYYYHLILELKHDISNDRFTKILDCAETIEEAIEISNTWITDWENLYEDTFTSYITVNN